MSGLVLYATKYGSTKEYASLIAEKLHTRAMEASEAAPEDFTGAGEKGSEHVKEIG